MTVIHLLFWYKSTNLVTSCLVEHEYPNGIFYFGVVLTGTGFYFLFQAQQAGWHVDRVEENKWYHIAIVRSSNEYDILRCFVNGTLIINTKTKMRSVPDSNRGIWFCRPPTKPTHPKHPLKRIPYLVYCLRKCLFKVYTY